MSPTRRLRCADLGEYPRCMALIDGADRDAFLERMRAHLRDVHGVTPAGFSRPLPDLEARLDDGAPPTTE